MRVLWLQNIVVRQMAEDMQIPFNHFGGWLEGLLDEMRNISNLELAIVAPVPGIKEMFISKRVKNIWFWGFKGGKVEENLENTFQIILSEFQPDLVHIFGTEFPHALVMVNAFGRPERTVIQIQGLVSVIAQYYEIGLSKRECKGRTLRDVLRNDSIERQKRRFAKRGKWEIKAIENVEHIIGRTDWDKACSQQINQQVKYHYCAEILRDEFYEGQWEYKKCRKHGIFMSQGNYPIKGFHIMLKALQLLKRQFPDVCLTVAGENPLSRGIKSSYYNKLICKKIKKLELVDNIRFVGMLDAAEMKRQYLLCNVFVSASLIENESNSLSEARILGVPSVSSYVGGVTGRIQHGRDGYLYPVMEPYMLAYYVTLIFENEELANRLSVEARSTQRELNNKRKNVDKLKEIYAEILEEG